MLCLNFPWDLYLIKYLASISYRQRAKVKVGMRWGFMLFLGIGGCTQHLFLVCQFGMSATIINITSCQPQHCFYFLGKTLWVFNVGMFEKMNFWHHSSIGFSWSYSSFKFQFSMIKELSRGMHILKAHG